MAVSKLVLPYGLGKLLDVYRPDRADQLPMVLLWHGSGPNEREVLKPLAQTIADAGHVVVVPDWQSDNAERARAQLLTSLRFGVEHAQDLGASTRIIIGGWSLGANSAADVALHPESVDGWRPNGLVGIAGSYERSPIRQRPIIDDVAGDRSFPLLLVHGRSDATVPIARSRTVHHHLVMSGWTSVLQEIDSDHAGSIGTYYSRARRRCVRARNPQALQALQLIAARVTELTHVA